MQSFSTASQAAGVLAVGISEVLDTHFFEQLTDIKILPLPLLMHHFFHGALHLPLGAEYRKDF